MPSVITGLLHVFTDGILLINVSRYLVLKIKLKVIGSENKLLTALMGGYSKYANWASKLKL